MTWSFSFLWITLSIWVQLIFKILYSKKETKRQDIHVSLLIQLLGFSWYLRKSRIQTDTVCIKDWVNLMFLIIGISIQFSCSVMSDSLWPPWIAEHQASLSFTNSQSLPNLMSIESVMPSNHLILCYPLLLLPSISPSIRAFSNESVLRIRWPRYWSFSFSISPSNLTFY